MTKEELIRNLKYTMKKHENDNVPTCGTNISIMCKDILDYLEQEPCDDAVSRQAVLNTLDSTDKFIGETRTVESYKALLEDCYNDLPFVTPTQRTGNGCLLIKHMNMHIVLNVVMGMLIYLMGDHIIIAQTVVQK